MTCETCKKEKCDQKCGYCLYIEKENRDVPTERCHGHPSQLDPLAGLKEEATDVIHDATKRNEWRCVEKEILVLLSRAFHLRARNPMTLPEVTAELKRIRAASNCRPVIATENDLSRLIAKLESSSEVDRELSTLMRGETLVSHSLEVKYIKA